MPGETQPIKICEYIDGLNEVPIPIEDGATFFVYGCVDMESPRLVEYRASLNIPSLNTKDFIPRPELTLRYSRMVSPDQLLVESSKLMRVPDGQLNDRGNKASEMYVLGGFSKAIVAWSNLE